MVILSMTGARKSKKAMMRFTSLSLKKSILAVLFFFFHVYSLVIAQQTGLVKGSVRDENNEPLAGAIINDPNGNKTTLSIEDGTFQLPLKSGKDAIIICSFLGYRSDTTRLTLQPGATTTLSIRLVPLPKILGEVVVENRFDRAESLQQISLRSIDHLPLPSGSLEGLLTTLGASSRNEMSSQYSVRGGNFDENLVYVNDIEIYRPLAVKAGQQEGLSFVNSSMISTIQFAAGGFDARYGDKMSSVLDIKYKRPDAFTGSVSAGLLGGSAHLEGCSANKKFTHITGIRYKSNQYLLKTLQTKGEYKPRFFDLQSFLTYKLTNRLEIAFLGNISKNTYQVIPQSRETAFGTYQQALNFTVYYDGQEVDRFTTMLGALTLDFRPADNLSVKLIGSAYSASEAITYDILGQYRIDLLDNTVGSKTSGDSILNIGVGGNLAHARNYIDAHIANLTLKGSYQTGQNNLNWGLSLQSERLDNKMREWEMIDSAGYSVPFSDREIVLSSSAIAHNQLNSIRFTGFVHHVSTRSVGNSKLYVNSGIRFNYWNINKQLVVSPRAGITLEPSWKNRFAFHASVGWYSQPPFFKEMIDPQGNLYTNIRAQKSIHYVLGSTYDFQMWKRPFKLTAELYYKQLDNLIPYIINDVDIQYLPQYLAKGYAAGIEFKLNGDFVKDAESWATLSFMKTMEDRYFDGYGAYPRPTDQLVNFGMFFQDYFPSNPSYRVYTTVYFGSRMPYSSPDHDNPSEYYHLNAYKRIDLGISKSFLTDKHGNRIIAANFLRDAWVSLEIFNLFGFNNQASYQWVRTVSNQEGLPNMFAIPNYLTGRLFNIRLTFQF
jgi:hypothetical protein